MKRKNLVTLIIGIALVAVIIGGTLAWFTDQAEVENAFQAGTVDIEGNGGVELDNSTLQNWNPGDNNFIKYTFCNTGTKNLRFRVGFSGEWGNTELSTDNIGLIGKDGKFHLSWFYDDPIELQEGIMAIADSPESTWDYDDDWYFKDGYLYYGGEKGTIFNPPNKGILKPGECVELVLEIKLDGPTTGNDYQGLKFYLDGQAQAIQASHTDEWDWDNIDFETGLEIN